MEDEEKNFHEAIPSLMIGNDTRFVLPDSLAPPPPTDALYTTEMIDPIDLGFIPRSSWTERRVSLQFLHENYFAKKNNVNRRFEQKLWNALRITQAIPQLFPHVGVIWVTNIVFKVNKAAFAQLLNIRSVDGGLFHKQGNFPRHGFVPLSDAAASQHVDPALRADVDGREIILLSHPGGNFTTASSEDEISQCRWDDPSTASRTATLRMGIDLPIDQ